jgi:hypothetical protein
MTRTDTSPYRHAFRELKRRGMPGHLTSTAANHQSWAGERTSHSTGDSDMASEDDLRGGSHVRSPLMSEACHDGRARGVAAGGHFWQ